MNLNKFSKPFPTKSSVLMVLLFAVLASCNAFKEADSLGINRVKVVDSGKDTIFSIANQKPYDALRVTIEGALSDTSGRQSPLSLKVVQHLTNYRPCPN